MVTESGDLRREASEVEAEGGAVAEPRSDGDSHDVSPVRVLR